MRSIKIIALAALTAFAVAARAQYNLDWNIPGDPALGGGVPSSAFSAAAPNHAGFWNDIPAQGSPSVQLRDLSGALTGVLLLGPSGGVGGGNNFTANTGDHARLQNDFRIVGNEAWTFTGLPSGPYRLYTYSAWPSTSVTNTTVTVAGANVPIQVVTGPMPGNAFQEGATHTVHDVLISNGTLTVQIDRGVMNAALNGMQLVAVPEPSAITIVAIGFLFGGWCRRRMR
jgi:hypothetical protein